MEAPKKLYLISDEDDVILSYDPSTKLQFGNRYDFVDKAVFPIEAGREIEYIRKDAFIEKACELLVRMIWEVTYEDLEGNSVQHYDKMEFIDDFRNYIKGE